MNPICPYCGKESKLVKGEEVYCGFESLKDKPYYECLPCDAHVGCHINTLVPLGTLADYNLRKARRQAHLTFDEVWKTYGMSRNHAYSWLSRQTRIPYKECHIGMMDTGQCELVILIVNQFKDTWK